MCTSQQLEKIKTIGDAYMVASGLPEPREDHAVALADLGLRMRAEVSQYSGLSLRVGINSGEVVAGVIGRHLVTPILQGCCDCSTNTPGAACDYCYF